MPGVGIRPDYDLGENHRNFRGKPGRKAQTTRLAAEELDALVGTLLTGKYSANPRDLYVSGLLVINNLGQWVGQAISVADPLLLEFGVVTERPGLDKSTLDSRKIAFEDIPAGAFSQLTLNDLLLSSAGGTTTTLLEDVGLTTGGASGSRTVLTRDDLTLLQGATPTQTAILTADGWQFDNLAATLRMSASVSDLIAQGVGATDPSATFNRGLFEMLSDKSDDTVGILFDPFCLLVGDPTFSTGQTTDIFGGGIAACDNDTGDFVSMEMNQIEMDGSGSGSTPIFVINGTQVVTERQAAVASPAADVAALKVAVDAIRNRLATHGLTAP